MASNQNCVSLPLQKSDDYHIKKFADIFNVSVKYGTTKNKYGIITEYAYCRLYNKTIFNNLFNIGLIPNKTYLGYINVLNNIDPQFHNSLILGLFDGDGSIFTSNTNNSSVPMLTISFACKGYDEIEWVKTIILNNINVNNSKINHHVNDIYRVSWSGYQVKSIMEWLYCDSPVYLNRKYIKYKEYEFEATTPTNSKYGYKGIEPKGNKWKSRIMYNGKKYFLGYYNNPKDAAIMYDLAIIYLDISPSKMNFKKETYNYTDNQWLSINTWMKQKFKI